MRIFRSAFAGRRSLSSMRAVALAALTVGMLAEARDARADVPISQEAREHFTAGVNLLQDPGGARIEEAYREFKTAYAASPSYKILRNLGLCAMRLERDQEAIESYEKYLAEGKDQLDATAVQEVTRDLQTLKAGVVWITVKSTPVGATLFDVRTNFKGEKVQNAYGPVGETLKLGIHQGTHQITAKLSGYPDVVWDFDTGAARELPEHAFEFKAAAVATVTPTDNGPRSVKTSERPVPTAVWIGAAATGALALGTAITGVMATSKHSDFQAANDGRDPSKADDLKKSGQTLNLVTDVLLGGTVVAAGVTAYFFVTRPTVEREIVPGAAPVEGRRVPRKEPWVLVPTASAKGGGLMLSGGLPWM